MNATQKGLVANIAGLIVLAAASQGVTLPPDLAMLLVSTLGSIGLGINQWLIHKAQKELPPTLQDNPSLLKNQAGRFVPQFASMLFVIAFALITLPACTTLGKNVDQSKIIVQVETMKVIEADRNHTAERAKQIREVAVEGKQFLDTNTVSVSLLADSINARLAVLDLAPSDRLLAAALVDAVVAELSARVGAGALSPEQRLNVSQVLGWIISATEFYAQ